MFSRILQTISVVALILLVSCTKLTETDNDEIALELESLKVSILIEQGSLFQQTSDSAVVLIFHNDSLVEEQDLTITNSEVSGRVDALTPATNVRVVVNVYNSQKELTYTGEALTDILAGTLTMVNITLRPSSGSIVVIGTIKEITSAIIIGSAANVEETFIAGSVPGEPSASAPWTNLTYGALGHMTLGEHDPTGATRMLVKFNSDGLPTIPVTSAKLILTVSLWVDHSFENANPMVVAVHKMLTPWSEGATKPRTVYGNSLQIYRDGLVNSSAINGATAAEASYGNPWNQRMVGLDNVDATILYADTDSHKMSEGVNISYELDVTDYVNSWINDSSTNFGLLIRPLIEDYNGDEISFPLFYSWENEKYTNHGPKLFLE